MVTGPSIFDLSGADLDHWQRGEVVKHGKLNAPVDAINRMRRGVNPPRQIMRKGEAPVARAVTAEVTQKLVGIGVVPESGAMSVREVVPIVVDGQPIPGNMAFVGEPFAAYPDAGLPLEFFRWFAVDETNSDSLIGTLPFDAAKRGAFWYVRQPRVFAQRFTFAFMNAGSAGKSILMCDVPFGAPGERIAIARPEDLRQEESAHGEITFDQSAHVRQQRTVTSTDPNELHQITRTYIAGDSVLAIGPVNTGATFGDINVLWQAIDNRKWGDITGQVE